ncbi:MAG: hypothetical protein JW765_01140 [Deltaproteobacteria bacterium]|nr:hypothetical protein [Candidatus Zymogenaceae bacterium]
MAEVKGISELAFRSCIDTIADIIGENGKNSILRYAGLEDYITSPPAYNMEAIVTPNSIITRFFKAVRDIMGIRDTTRSCFAPGSIRSGSSSITSPNSRALLRWISIRKRR